MFLDASAVVAVLAREPGFEKLAIWIDAVSGGVAVSPLVRFEAVLSLARKRSLESSEREETAKLLEEAGDIFDQFLDRIGAKEISLSPELGRDAVAACAKYGKAVGHSAGLNFGDCFAYACAKSLGVGLIYKGDDFAKTDLA